jgi:UDP-2,3-diacylglucosamine pyrophosphatase LpxH
VDGRWSKVYDTGNRIIINMINLALQKHEFVYVVVILGNHDDMASTAMSTTLRFLYANEPRIKILGGCEPMVELAIGNYGLMSTHGHSAKLDGIKMKLMNLSQTMKEATRVWVYCGHIHSQKVHDFGNAVVEYFRTLAPNDYYSASCGYVSACEMQARTYSLTTGAEMGRVIFTPDYQQKT